MKKVLLFLFILFFASPYAFILASDKVEINTASLQQLDEITGIGPTMAQRIINDRPFSSVDDLLRVSGIGEKTLKKIKDQGLAYVDSLSLRGGPQADAATPTSNKIASSPEDPRNDMPAIVYPDGVFINEVLPSPEGSDETEEWIEFYNSNDFEVDLSGWQIKDIAGTNTIFTFTKDTKILKNAYLVLKRPETEILLNNDEDGLDLVTPDGSVKDSVSFTKALLGQSYNKTNSGWQWSKTLTPSATNIIAVSKKTLPKTGNSVKNNIEAKDFTADISQSLSQEKNKTSPWFLFFTALAITIISAGIVLFVKLKLKNNAHVRT